jgi:hypothetical protein
MPVGRRLRSFRSGAREIRPEKSEQEKGHSHVQQLWETHDYAFDPNICNSKTVKLLDQWLEDQQDHRLPNYYFLAATRVL